MDFTIGRDWEKPGLTEMTLGSKARNTQVASFRLTVREIAAEGYAGKIVHAIGTQLN